MNVVQKTLDILVEKLRGFPQFRSLEPVDKSAGKCIISLSGDLKETVKDFCNFLNNLKGFVVPDSVQKVKNNVRFKIPLSSFEGVLLQVDAEIQSVDDLEQFGENLSKLGPDNRVLVDALVQSVLYRKTPEECFNLLGIRKVPELEGDQEYEFVLHGDSLDLIIKDLSDGAVYTVWSSTKWDSVKNLLKGVNLEDTFDDLLSSIAKMNVQTRRKILGVLKEVPGYEEDNIKADKIKNTLGEIDNTREISKVLIFAGKFRPPFKAHFDFLEKVQKKVDRIIVIVDENSVKGIPISAEQSKKIWQIYSKYVDVPLEVRCSSAVEDSISDLINNPEIDVRYLICFADTTYEVPESENKDLTVKTLTKAQLILKGSLSDMIKTIRKGLWVPDQLIREDMTKAISIIVDALETQQIQETVEKEISNTLERVLEEASSGTPIEPSTVISSENRDKLSKLYKQMIQQVGSEFDIQFLNTCIVIKPKYTNLSLNESDAPEDFNYVPYIASYLEYLQKEGKKVQPLPEIILNKEEQNGDLISHKTGEYNPVDKIITLYTAERNPKDVLRSFAHEMEHHIQCLEGKLERSVESKVSESQDLENLEAEAYQRGNISFRKWTETRKEQ